MHLVKLFQLHNSDEDNTDSECFITLHCIYTNIIQLYNLFACQQPGW